MPQPHGQINMYTTFCWGFQFSIFSHMNTIGLLLVVSAWILMQQTWAETLLTDLSNGVQKIFPDYKVNERSVQIGRKNISNR